MAAEPINPEYVAHVLNEVLPANAILTADSGSVANWYARHVRMHGTMRGSLSGTLASMGPAVPYGIGAKFGHPDRPVIAFAGDGAMQMNGLAELITISRYWQEWTDPRLVVAVLHNNDLNQVTWEMRAMGGEPKLADSQTLPDVSYAAFAAALGFEAVTVDDPEQVGPAWDRALAAGKPAVIDVLCDGDVARFGHMQARFSQPMFPGQELVTRIWRADGGAQFQTFAEGKVVLDRGVFRSAA